MDSSSRIGGTTCAATPKRRATDERNAEIIRRYEAGEGPRAISRAMGHNHNITAGVLHRHRHPGAAQDWRGGFRDLPRTLEAVALADEIGLLRACELLLIDKALLCRWRQRVRQIEARA